VRAKNRCEVCGCENYKPHPQTGAKVILTVAHLNHIPEDCRYENLKSNVPKMPQHLRCSASQRHKIENKGSRLRKSFLNLKPQKTMKNTYRITFEIDDEMIESINEQLLDVGIKPNEKLVETIIRRYLYNNGSQFIVSPQLYVYEDDKETFIKEWSNLKNNDTNN